MLAALTCAAWGAEPSLPLESVSFDVDVIGDLAEVVITQRFRNTTDRFVDATYVFPLDNDAAVDAMVMTIGDRVVRSEIEARDVARQEFAAAAAAGHVAALTEQQRPNVFTQDVANLPPDVPIDVTLRLVQPVDRIDSAWTIVLPLVVGPRFYRAGDRDEAPQNAEYVAPVGGRDGRPDSGLRRNGTGVRATLDVAVHAGQPIREIRSPSHPIAPVVTDADATVHLRDVPLTRDVVLSWRTAGKAPAAGLLVGGGHAMLMLEAPLATAFSERVPRELIWVVDTSCSMSGEPLMLAQQAMAQALTSMDARDTFAIFGFGDDVQSATPGPVPAVPAHVEHGLQFIGALRTDGGTRMDLALREALRLPVDPERRRTVVFVTDGLIGYDTQLLQEIGAAAPHATFVSLGIGSAPNRYLLDEMARLGGGVSAYAVLGDNPSAGMADLVDAMDRPVWSGVRVDFGPRCPVDGIAPVTVPDLRAGRPVRLLARVPDGCAGEAVISAQGPAGTEELHVPVRSVAKGRALASSWARERVADLERQWMRGETGDVRAQIREVGLAYGIVTSETSLLAVDSVAVNGTGRSVPARQPLDVPDGLYTASTSQGTVISREFLQRIPAGRTYQSAVQTVAGVVNARGGNPNIAGGASNENTYVLDGAVVTDPVSGTFSLNFHFDTPQSVAVVDRGRLPAVGGDPQVEVNTASGTNNLELRAEVGGLLAPDTGAVGPNGDASGRIGGPLVRDRLWLSMRGDTRVYALGGVYGQSLSWSLNTAAQPARQHRFTLRGSGDTTDLRAEGGDLSFGGTALHAQWAWFPSPTVGVQTAARAMERRLGTDMLRSIALSTALSAASWRDPLGLVHALEAGASASQWNIETEDDTVRAGSASVYAQDAVDLGRILVAGGARLDGVGGELFGSPRLFAAWDPFGDERTKLSGGYGRYVSPARWLPSDRAEVAVPLRNELFLAVEREILRDLALAATVTQSDVRFSFAADPSSIFLPEAAAPGVTQSFLAATFGLRKIVSRRWEAGASVRWLPAPATADPDLLADPLAPFVSGFLDAYRRWSLGGNFGWDLPTDPWTLSVGGFARWSEAIDPDGPWWLADVLTWGVTARQHIDLRRGELIVAGTATWTRNDLATSWLPAQSLVWLPDAPTPDRQPPLRVEVSVAYDF